MTVSSPGGAWSWGEEGSGEGRARGGWRPERSPPCGTVPPLRGGNFGGKRVSQGSLSRAGPSSPSKFHNFPEFSSAATPPGCAANPRRLRALPLRVPRVGSANLVAPQRVGMVHSLGSPGSQSTTCLPHVLGGHGSDAMVALSAPMPSCPADASGPLRRGAPRRALWKVSHLWNTLLL